MKRNDFDILTSEQGQQLIEQHIDGDSVRLALKLRNPTVTQQIHVLQKCRGKLPSYYKAQCVVSQLAYEQASSEATAAVRAEGLEGLPSHQSRLAVDLTCGLGVDSLMLSRVFDRVIAVEIDPIKADVARWNFAALGASNVEVVCDSAENFLANLSATSLSSSNSTAKSSEQENCEAPIDLIYADPSRKSRDGRRVYSLEDSSPRILELLPSLRQLSQRIIVKLSPLFDVAEIYRLFGDDTCVEVVSLGGECKEVLAKIGFNQKSSTNNQTPYLRVTCIDKSKKEILHYDFDRDSLHADTNDATDVTDATRNIPMSEARFLLTPDVGFYKARAVGAYVAKYLTDTRVGLRLLGDYIFSDEPIPGFAGKTYRITFHLPYQPKEIKRIFNSQGIRRLNVHRRNFPYSTEQICKTLEIKMGGDSEIFCTMIDGEPTVFFVGRIN